MPTTQEYNEFVRGQWGRTTNSNVTNLGDLFVMTTGLAGETGEVCEKLKKHVRDGVLDTKLLTKELGDVLFYLTRIGQEFEIPLEEIMNANIAKLKDRRERGVMRGSGDER